MQNTVFDANSLQQKRGEKKKQRERERERTYIFKEKLRLKLGIRKVYLGYGEDDGSLST